MGPNPAGLVSLWEEGRRTQTRRGDHMRTGEKTVTCRLRRVASGEASPAVTLALGSSLRNCEEINTCHMSPPSVGFGGAAPADKSGHPSSLQSVRLESPA